MQLAWSRLTVPATFSVLLVWAQMPSGPPTRGPVDGAQKAVQPPQRCR